MNDSILMIAGGGTGGHVLAGVAVADAWMASFSGETGVVFVGARGGIEEKLVPKAGYPLELLELGALNRVGLARKLKTLFQLPFTFLRSARLIVKYRPRAVLGVGGYSSGPVLLAAKTLSLLGLNSSRTAILEQNTVAGMTNRWLGKFADQVFTAFPGTDRSFPGRAVRVTGNPVRKAIGRLPEPRWRPFTIFVFGGSQGAMGINTLVLEALSHLADLRGKLRFIHQTGEKDFERVAKGYRDAGFDGRIEKFIYDMPEVYAESSLLVCRAGSSTLSEIAAVGRPAVLIPFPQAADNHQEVNARVFADAGAAALYLQPSPDRQKAAGEALARMIRDWSEDPRPLAEMTRKVADFHKPAAASEIVAYLRAPAGSPVAAESAKG